MCIFRRSSEQSSQSTATTRSMNRRHFLKLLAGAVVTVPFISILRMLNSENGLITGNESEYDSEYIRAAIQWLNEVYAYKIFTDYREIDDFVRNLYTEISKADKKTQQTMTQFIPVVLLEKISATDLEIALSYLIESPEGITKYPTDFFRRNNITGTRFVQNLITNDNVFSCCYENQGVNNHIEYSGGRTDSIESTTFVSVRSGSKNMNNSAGVTAAFDHENYHLLDMKDEFLGGLNIDTRDNRAWVALNGTDNLYTYETYEEYRKKIRMNANLGKEDERFASRYGMRNENEDRSEYAELVLSPTRFKVFQKRTRQLLESMNAKDRFIASVRNAKVAFIQNNYTETSGGKMNAAYWQAVADGSLSAEFFLSQQQVNRMPILSNYSDSVDNIVVNN